MVLLTVLALYGDIIDTANVRHVGKVKRGKKEHHPMSSLILASTSFVDTTCTYRLSSPIDAMCHHLVACSFLVFDIMCEVVLSSDVSNLSNDFSQYNESQPGVAHEPHTFQKREQPQLDSVLQTSAAHGHHVVLAEEECW